MSTLGERLRIARERKGFSQTEVYRRTNINNKTLSKYEKNDTKPDIETVTDLANFYDVSVEWLLTGQSPTKNDDDKSDFDPEVRSLARDIKNLQSSDKALLKDLIKSMQKRGKKALDE
ncbi:helix-turn-helix domain-containing protein [Mesobacillus jeotgali]|uniref:helix-turn-helix domain-containing protein n=1 Tax=Mesobacillus jeotgali TaxID=129985 RepID=UPI001CFD3991|nr:helix-turn-helix transcriptional regulator [Mesobacillus jeotgali]